MWDIFFAAMLLIVASLGLFWSGFLAARRMAGAAVGVLCLLAMTLTTWYTLQWRGTAVMARLIPLSSAIVLTNWVPLGAAFLSGALAGNASMKGWRRTVLTAALLAIAWHTVLADLPTQRIAAQDTWTTDQVCIQSSPSSCSVCCAVMLLRHYGMATTEQEMADLCLTTEKGTPSLGLFRGLTLKTARSAWRVELVRADVDRLRTMQQSPVILLVNDDTSPLASTSLVSQLMSAKQARHAVLLYGITEDGRVLVGDPAVGREQWTLETLENRWRSDGFRLVARRI